MFKWQTLDLNFYFIYISARILVGLLIGGLLNFTITPAIISGIFFIVFLLTIIRKPYADIQHTVRSSVNYFIACLIFGMYSALSINGTQSGKSFDTKFPLIIVCLLFFVTLMALGYVIRQFIMDRRTKMELDEPSNIVE